MAYRWRIFGVAVAAAGVVALYALSTPLVGARLLQALEPETIVPAAPAAPAPGAIVILAADLRRDAPDYGGDTVGALTLERIRYGARLHRMTGLPILVSGGLLPRAKRTLAEAMQRTLTEEFGVPVQWVENRSRSTLGNARLSAELLKSAGIGSIYLVTHAWHMARSVEVFESNGMHVVAAPTAFTYVGPGLAFSDFLPRPAALAESTFAFHELIGRLWYRLRAG